MGLRDLVAYLLGTRKNNPYAPAAQKKTLGLSLFLVQPILASMGVKIGVLSVDADRADGNRGNVFRLDDFVGKRTPSFSDSMGRFEESGDGQATARDVVYCSGVNVPVIQLRWGVRQDVLN